jgi:hypothetical protein
MLLRQRAPLLRRNLATTHEVPEQTSTKKAAYSIFDKPFMWPLVLLTIGIGYFGYNYRAGITIGPDVSHRKDKKSMEDLKKESRTERELVQKSIAEVDKDRNDKQELVWSKGTLEKNSYESSPDGSPNKKPSDIRK